jgi:hypothetical protein
MSLPEFFNRIGHQRTSLIYRNDRKASRRLVGPLIGGYRHEAIRIYFHTHTSLDPFE